MPKISTVLLNYVSTVLLLGCFYSLAVAQAGDAETIARYILQPSDEVTIKYRYTPEFDQSLKIQPDGFVALEMIGELKIGGLTLAEAKTLIVEKAKARLKDPEISVALKDFEGPYFLVSGEVTKPGKFELRGHTTVLQAVLLAGGFKDEAKTSQVVVLRRITPELVEVKTVNLGKTTKRGAQIEDLPIQPGDMVMVSQSALARVGRYLKATNVGLFLNPLQWIK